MTTDKRRETALGRRGWGIRHLGTICLVAFVACSGGCREKPPGGHTGEAPANRDIDKDKDQVRTDEERYQELMDQAFERHRVDLAGIREITQVELPKTTELIEAETFSWLEEHLYAKLQMGESAYRQFISLPRFSGAFSSTDRHGVANRLASLQGRISWWNPDDIQHFFAAEDTAPDPRKDGDRKWWARTAVLISAEPTEKGAHTLYLYWNAWRE